MHIVSLSMADVQLHVRHHTVIFAIFWRRCSWKQYFGLKVSVFSKLWIHLGWIIGCLYMCTREPMEIWCSLLILPRNMMRQHRKIWVCVWIFIIKFDFAGTFDILYSVCQWTLYFSQLVFCCKSMSAYFSLHRITWRV